MKSASFKELFEDFRAIGGAIALVLGSLESIFFPIVPIAPAFHVLAVLLVIIFCLLVSLAAFGSAQDAAQDASGNSRNRKLGFGWLIFGAVLFVAHFAYSGFLNGLQTHSQSISLALFCLQAVSFAAPWASLSAAGVMFWPRK